MNAEPGDEPRSGKLYEGRIRMSLAVTGPGLKTPGGTFAMVVSSIN